MKIQIENTELQTLAALAKYDHEIVNVTDTHTHVELHVNDADDLAKETGNGEYYFCEVTRYGNTKQTDVFWNWLTDGWEHDATYHAEVREINK